MLRGSYTQIMVNTTQHTDHEFMAWMDGLVEVRWNRQNNKPCPYTQFRHPYSKQETKTLRNKVKPAGELNTNELMAHMRCKYVDIEETVEMYNLDVEECRSVWLPKQYKPDEYLHTLEPPDEICIINNIQKRGTSFPILIQGPTTKLEHNTLLDMGATRSCMNHKMAYQLGKGRIKAFNKMQVVWADGSHLGAIIELLCNIEIGDTMVQQSFIVCKHLRGNIILGTDFT